MSVENIRRSGVAPDSGIVKELQTFHSTKSQKKDKSYGDLHFKESVFLTVLSVHLLDEIFILDNSLDNILNGEFK